MTITKEHTIEALEEIAELRAERDELAIAIRAEYKESGFCIVCDRHECLDTCVVSKIFAKLRRTSPSEATARAAQKVFLQRSKDQ